MDREALLRALEERRDELLECLARIGSEKDREFEVSFLATLNKVSDESQTMEEFLDERRTEIKAQLTENAYTYDYVRFGTWTDSR